jgi:hypothetical protein
VPLVAFAATDPSVTLSASGSTNITTSTLLGESSGAATDNAAVDAATESLTPINISLANTSANSYSAVRVAPVGDTSGNLQLWAKDSTGQWWDVNVVGWGPSTGFPLPANYSAATPVYAISDQAASYSLNYNLLDLTADSNVIATDSGVITASAPASTPTPADLVLTVPPTVSIIQSTLVPETTGVPTGGNDTVATAVAGLTPIAVTLQNTGDTASGNIRISPINAGSHVQFWAKDTSNNWYDVNVTGWGPATGFSVPATSGPIITDIYVLSDAADSYPLAVNLVDAATPSTVVATAAGTLTVSAPVSAATVTSASSIADIAVANGTALDAAGLPTTASVTLSDNTTPSYAVTWDGGSPTYDGNIAGIYTFTGTLTVPDGVTNPDNKTATVNVVVAASVSGSGESQTATPTIITPIYAGATSVSGTSENNASISLSINGGAAQTATTNTNGNWAVTGLTLATGDIVSVTATGNGETISAAATATVVAPSITLINNLQPSWDAPGGGVWAAYYAPDSNTSAGVSPGTTAVYDGREAAIIKAGITAESDGSYQDEGLLGFKVNSVSLSSFASQPLSYDVENATGPNPVWVRIRLTDANKTEYQFVPSQYSLGAWHTVNAAAGQWQLMDNNGNATGVLMTLAQVAESNPGVSVDRVYLTLGMGNSYNISPGVGTVAWVDTVTIGGTKYNFTAPVVNNATLSVDPTYGLVLNFQTNEALDLSTAANVQISYFTKVGDTLTPISNAIAGGALVKDKTWDGYFVDASGNHYSKGTANISTDSNAVPADTTFTTLVKKGFKADGSMDYVAITDWTQPATYVVQIVVTDNAGNVSEMKQVETTVAAPADTTDPVITLLGDSPVTVAQGSTFTDPGATATDNVDGNLTSSIVPTSDVNTAVVGIYHVSYNVSDAAGNAANTVTREVDVTDQTAPTATVSYDVTAPTNGSVVATITPSETVTGNLTHTFTDNGSFTFDFTDLAGNSGSVVATVSNIDKVAPVITIAPYTTTPTNADVTVNASADKGTLNADSHTFTENGSFDFVATDAAGNSTTQTVTITNIDKVAPTAAVSYDKTALTNTDVTATIAPSKSVTVTNNGGALTHTFTANGSFTFDFIDAAGNTGTAVATVNNIDKTAPIISLTGDSSMTVAQGSTFTDPGATATDDVDVTDSVSVSGTVNTATDGTYTLTYNCF